MKAHKGSITVMLLLVLCAIIMAVTLVVEVARIKIAEGQAKRAVDTAIFSALSSYDQDTKDEYGLFYRYGTEGLDAEIKDAVEKTLLVDDGSKAWRPYEYQIQAMNVRILFPLNDKESIKHQILEYMKYRGPTALVGDVAKKMSNFFSMKSTAQVMKADLKVDKKVKKLADKINELNEIMVVVKGYNDSKLGYSNTYAKQMAEAALAIEHLKDSLVDIDYSEDPPNAEDIANNDRIHEQIADKREEIDRIGTAVLAELNPVLEANQKALRLCKEMAGLSKEIDAAIQESEGVLEKEKQADPDVGQSLKDKYADYKKYTNASYLRTMEENLQKNIDLLQPKVDGAKEIMNGGPGYPRSPIYETLGYVSDFETPAAFPGGGNLPDGPKVDFNAALLGKLIGKVKGYVNGMKDSVVIEDNGPILTIPGNPSNSSVDNPTCNAGGDYEGANDTLSSTYDSLGADVDTTSAFEALAQGTLAVAGDTYNTLLINEYVLGTFNNRERKDNVDYPIHKKRSMKETEVEYVLVGSDDPKINAAVSQLEIIGWRTVFNAVSFSFYCPQVKTLIDSSSVAMNAATGVPYPIWKGVITGLLSFVESFLDTRNMLIGEEVPMFKFKVTDITFVKDFEDLASELSSVGGGQTDEQPLDKKESPKAVKTKAERKNLMVGYKDHLRAMLFYRSTWDQGNTTLSRIQNLVFTNIKETRGEYDPTKHFNFIEVDAQFTIKSFFPNLSGIKAQVDGIPVRHTITVECGRGY